MSKYGPYVGAGVTVLLTFVLGMMGGALLAGYFHSAPTPPPPSVTLPDNMTVLPSYPVNLHVTATGPVEWESTPGCYLLPDKGGYDAYFAAPREGTYTITARAASGSRIAVAHTVIVVKDVGPTPPGPGPGPGPGPQPPDALTATFQAKYDLDKDADRARSLAYLASAYRAMTAAAPARVDIRTNDDAHKWIATVVQAPGVGLSAAQVVNLRRAIADEMKAALGDNPSAPIELTKLAAELDKIAKALSGVK